MACDGFWMCLFWFLGVVGFTKRSKKPSLKMMIFNVFFFFGLLVGKCKIFSDDALFSITFYVFYIDVNGVLLLVDRAMKPTALPIFVLFGRKG